METIEAAGWWLLLFGTTVALDYAWGYYITATASKQAYRAAFASVAIYVLGALLTAAFIDDWWTMIPIMAGTFVGTLWSVKNQDD